ncbi:MAG: AAA family ATPase [Myxococcota bacterium]
MKLFEHVPARLLASQKREESWLIEGLWSERAVGIVGGEPKCCKSLLALDMAVSVASGRACLRRFGVREKGPVLLYAAEDPLHVVRARLEGIALAAGADFESLDVHVITAARLRLDLHEHTERLLATVDELRPKLLVLDPFVRLHRIDENVAAEVAPLLERLRTLERRFQLAVVLVHHSRKSAASARGGQALRGSSELHAWGDSNLYLRRKGEQLLLRAEHRAAASHDADLFLELRDEDGSLALHIADEPSPMPTRTPSPEERVLDVLRETPGPMSTRLIRERCRMRTASVVEVLECLVEKQRVRRLADGYTLIENV